MRFIFSDIKRPGRSARDLCKFLAERGIERRLTQCQEAVALAAGFQDWRELAAVCEAAPSAPSPLDDAAGTELPAMRLVWQAYAFAQRLEIGSELAREAAEAVGLTASRRQVLALPEAAPVTEVRIFILTWEESERGWGVRPDGYSIHASAQACKDYIAAYWARMPKTVPDEYERPAWDEPTEVAAMSDSLVARALADGHVRVYRVFDGEHGDLYKAVGDLLRTPTPAAGPR